MALRRFTATNFRCLERIDFEPDPGITLIAGANASGKTSILEAIAYLGRGRSFRGSTTAEVVRHGEREFVLFGEAEESGRVTRVGVRNGADGLEVHVGGEAAGGAAALAEALPLQVIGPDVHDLVGGSPEERRKYLDWIAFHVEPGYVEQWRRFRRVLRQRNAALKQRVHGATLSSWTEEFLAASEAVDAGRRRALDVSETALQEMTGALVGPDFAFAYDSGWNEERGLKTSLEGAAERERQVGSTQFGPHRGDLKIERTSRKARSVVSRGQQKLLAASMLLAATRAVKGELGRQMLLLVDDPGAELDRASLGRLIDGVLSLDTQVIATSLDPGAIPIMEPGALFHVEQGRLHPG